MSLEAKQMMEKNRRARRIAIAILIFGFVLCALGFVQGVSIVPSTIIRVAIFPIDLVALLVLYSKYKESDIFMNIGFVVLMVAYVAVIFFTRNQYMYAYIYLIILYIVLYMNPRFTKVGIIIANIFNIMATSRFLMLKNSGVNETVIQAIFVAFASVMLHNIVSISHRHTTETMDTVKANAEKEVELTNQIIELSENLAEKFEVAKQDAEVMIGNVTASTDAVSEISDSIKVTAESIEKQTGLTADIQTSLEETGRATEEMKAAADASANAVSGGKKAMEVLAKQAELTGELNKKSQETTEELGNRIHEVESITGEILNISSQTNLLALNASIEAARAGEAGRGFAVVADEIRQLSEQTKNSVNRITEITNRLVDNSKEASDNMSKSITASEEQNVMVKNAIAEIDTIAEKNDILVERMDMISKQISGILHANTEINDSISNLSAMSEQVSASAENCFHVMDDSMHSCDSLTSLLAEIYEISEQMQALTKK